MKCPICNEDLLMSERLTIQIDYCPKCRGIWLEKGKLDKIIEQSNLQDKKTQVSRKNHEDEYKGYSEHKHKDGHHDDEYDEHKYKKKKGFLENLFD